MNDGHHDPADRTQLGSHEYRTRLLTKLNCLIAVVEVAIAKIGHNLEAPGANEERLLRIRTNLQNTLAICQRAKSTLQRVDAPRIGGVSRARPADGQMSYRDYVELSSIDEYRKFKTLPPIQRKDLDETDIDELLRRLSQS
jgi:hypothetical protein